MKSKKTSLARKINNIKFNFTKNSKWFWIASVVIFIAGLFVSIFAGYNLNAEYKGTNVLSVNLGEQIDTNKEFKNVSGDIIELLHDCGLTLAGEPQKQGEADGSILIIKYNDKKGASKSSMQSITNSIRTQINEKYNADFVALDDEFDITSNSGKTTGSSTTSGLMFNAIVALTFALAIVLLYNCIRFGVMSGLSSILGIVHDIVITLALVAMFRVNVSPSIYGGLAVIGTLSVINSLIIYGRIKENLKNPALTDKTNQEIANMSVKQSLTRVALTTILMLVAALLFISISTNTIREFVLVILLGTIVTCYSTIFLMPAFWANVNHKRTLSKPSALVEQEEVVELSQNDNDIEAEVIDVEDDQTQD